VDIAEEEAVGLGGKWVEGEEEDEGDEGGREGEQDRVRPQPAAEFSSSSAASFSLPQVSSILQSSLRCSGRHFELKRELTVLELAIELEVLQFDVGKDEGCF
jgi:hypothetical protein